MSAFRVSRILSNLMRFGIAPPSCASPRARLPRPIFSPFIMPEAVFPLKSISMSEYSPLDETPKRCSSRVFTVSKPPHSFKSPSPSHYNSNPPPHPIAAARSSDPPLPPSSGSYHLRTPAAPLSSHRDAIPPPCPSLALWRR